MIFNRTEKDVVDAISIRDEKVKKGIALTEDDLYVIARGFCGVDTLNRIEQKQIELRHVFENAGYYNMPTQNKEWSETDVFFNSDLKRIAKNNKLLRNAFYVLAETPQNAVGVYHYEDFNKIEKILNDLETVYEYMVLSYKECGNAESGG